MDFAWPLSEHVEEPQAVKEDAQSEPKGSAMDFVMNAWSLLRGGEVADSSSSTAKGDASSDSGEVKTNIAQVSFAAAGGASNDKDVDFVKQSWALYQQAMEEGWVTEWIENFTTPNVTIIDTVGRPKPAECNGQAEMAKYYNAVLDSIWDNGRVSVTWKPRSFQSMASGVVLAEYDIEVHPRNVTHTRQLWIYRVEGEKIAEIRMYATVPPDEVDRAPVNMSDIRSHPKECAETPECGPMKGYPPMHMAAVQGLPYQHFSGSLMPHACDTPGNHSLIPDNVSVAESMPSLASSMHHASVGVSLTRPCQHNSWDNVRIKRGWAILRCRICQSQWRLRPTAIPHCPEFARGAGCCPRGTDCPQLHVHRTREQSSEAKKAAATARCAAPMGVPQKTVTVPSIQSLSQGIPPGHPQNVLKQPLPHFAGLPQKNLDPLQPSCSVSGGAEQVSQNGPPQSALGAHTPYPQQHQPYAMY